jgi:2-polyprenyl-3-methyl-5-hydroxy-6-metoxy-1,4-benzoquinol methylase
VEGLSRRALEDGREGGHVVAASKPVDSWIEAVVKGKSFIDVGGLWGVVNEKVTVAARAGASRMTMMDISPPDDDLWEQFSTRCAEAGVAHCRCLAANLDDATVADVTNVYDVVHCGGVLYHCPNPVHTIGQLARMCGETLIIATTIVPDKLRNARGELTLAAGSLLFVPGLTDQQREVITEYWNEVGAQAVGLNVPLSGGWRLDHDYAPWWWLFTADFVPAVLRVSGFTVVDRALTWNDHVGLYLARRAVGKETA